MRRKPVVLSRELQVLGQVIMACREGITNLLICEPKPRKIEL
jgi:hypothetical protein